MGRMWRLKSTRMADFVAGGAASRWLRKAQAQQADADQTQNRKPTQVGVPDDHGTTSGL